MLLPQKMIWSLVVLVILMAASASPVSAEVSNPVIPPGFALIRSHVGVALYQKNYPGGSPDFVLVLSLDQGAMLKPLITSISDPRTGKGVYGGSDARFRSQSLGAYWAQFSGSHPNAFCVANGQFFYMKEYPTRLPFPLKIDGEIVTDGYGIQQFTDQKLMLELWPGRADITPLSKEALYNSNAPDIIAGLTEDAPKQKKRYTGRTFVGLDDLDGNGQFETLLVVTTKTARQIDAADVLRSFGADKVMMLDGGGSTQLSCQGDSYVFSERILPQAVGVLAGPGESAKLNAGAQVAQVISPEVNIEKVQDSEQQAQSIQPADQNQATQSESNQGDVLPSAPAEEASPAAQAAEMAPLIVTEGSPAQQESAAPAASPENASLEPSAVETQAQSSQQSLEIQPSSAAVVAAPANRDLTGSHSGEQIVLDYSPNLASDAKNTAPLTLQAQQYLNMVANRYKSTAVSASQPAAVRAVKSGTAAVGEPIQISGVLWVPASMLPVVLVLLFAVAKIRHVRD